jgi:hypothetical protein
MRAVLLINPSAWPVKHRVYHLESDERHVARCGARLDEWDRVTTAPGNAALCRQCLEATQRARTAGEEDAA